MNHSGKRQKNKLARLVMAAAIAGLTLVALPLIGTPAYASDTGGTFCAITISSKPSGLLWGTTTTVTGDKCGTKLKVRAIIECDGSHYPREYGSVLASNGTTSATCNALTTGNRLVYGYQTLDYSNPSQGWVSHWIGR